MKSTVVDTHCHLTHGRLRAQLPAVLSRAERAGVTRMISATSGIADSAAAAALAETFAGIYCTAGIHPHDAKDARCDYLDRLAELARHPKNVAVGEIGLDFFRDLSPRDLQRRIFAEQLALAGRLGKPVVIHTRDAFDDTMAVLAESGFDGRRVVFHCFPGSPAQAGRALDIGAAISFSGTVTYKRSVELRESAALVPDDRLLIETDAPYLSPEPVRKIKTNEPANVVHVAACLAGARRTTPERIAELTTANAVRFFGLKA